MPLKPLPWFLRCYMKAMLMCCCPQFKLRAQHMAWIFKGNFKIRWQYCLIRKINYRLPEQVGLPQSSCPYRKSGNKKFRSHTQNIITGKELLLYNKNEGKQTKAKISHVKSMDNLHLHVHPVIANIELTF